MMMDQVMVEILVVMMVEKVLLVMNQIVYGL